MEAQELVPAGTPGAVVIEGAVLDGEGRPVPDAMVEVWQANSSGRFHFADDGSWEGFGRSLTDDAGRFRFVTVKPGTRETAGLTQAPHLELSLFARGLVQRLRTRMYFPDEQLANESDPLLASISDPERRSTLVARPAGPGALRFDLRLQGEQETVFLDR